MSVRGSDENFYSASSDSFWDIGNYKRTVKRIDDGAKLCDDFMKLVCERAEIEAKYSFKLKAWAKKWEELIKSGPEYANMETAMRGTVVEAEARSELHIQCRDRLMENVNEALKKWKQESYHKGIFQWKETKEAEDGFVKAQKPWAKRLAKLLKAKKAYHNASRTNEDATKRESEVNRDSEKSADKIKKLQEASERAKREMERCREKYQVRLDEITAYNPQYEQDMKLEFRNCQTSEEIRLDFFKESLVNYHRCLNVSESPELTRMFTNMIETFQKAQTDQILDWWSKNHGVDMPQYWPVFEQLPKPKQKTKVKQDQRKKQQRESIFHRLQTFSKPSDDPVEELGIDEHLEVENQVRQPEKDMESETDSWSSCSDGAVFESISTTEKKLYVRMPFSASVASEVVHSETLASPQACSSRVEDHYKSPLYCTIPDTASSKQRQGVVSANEAIVGISHTAGTELSPGGRPLTGCSADGLPVNLDADRPLGTSVPEEEHDDPPLSRQPTLTKVPQPLAPSDPQGSLTANSMVYGGVTNHNEDSPVYQDSNQFAPGPSHYMYDSPSKWDGPTAAPPIENNVGLPVRALYDFDGQEQDELSFKEGDIITKLSEGDDQGWCQGQFQGKEGHFPDAYVELC